MLNNINDYLTRIDNMQIYEKDYDVLNKLLNLEHDLFIKILEEILLGTIYISDLEAIFSDDSYKNILSRELEHQKHLKEKQDIIINKLKDMANVRNIVDISNFEYITNIRKIIFTEKDKLRLSELLDNLASNNIIFPHNKLTLENLKYYIPDTYQYKDEIIRLVTKKLSAEIYETFRIDRRDSLFYELLQKNSYESINNAILKSVRYKFFKMIETGYFIEKELKQKPNNISFEIINDNGINKVKIGANQELQSFIMPDDFLFSADDPIIPISYDDIQLNEHDIEYMKINGLSSDEMKKMKSLYLTLMREDFLRKNIEIN